MSSVAQKLLLAPYFRSLVWVVVQDTGVWLAILLLGVNSIKFFEVLWGFLNIFYYETKILVDKLSL